MISGRKPRVAVINRTDAFGHFGCKLVCKALEENLNVVKWVDMKSHWAQHDLSKVDLVVVNGEGSLHHNRRTELLSVAQVKPSVLINTVYQDMDETSWVKQFKYVAARESLSAAALKEHGVDACVVPDLIFSQDVPKGSRKSHSLLEVNSVVGGRGLKPIHPHFIEIAQEHGKMLTGRFHAACLAMMWGIPFAAYGSNTWKTKGMMQDAGLSHLYAETWDEAKDLVGTYCTNYPKQAKTKIAEMFRHINSL